MKSAEHGCPTRLFDTLSSFSNQDEGGIIIFGIDERQDYKEVGVYDPQDIQKKINEQCLQMEPKVRPLLTVLKKDGKSFVSAEIPGIDLAERPCYYQGKGRLNITAVREAILNALVHRDYSIHTEGMPIQLKIFDDRLEIYNPGGIYGRIKIDQLGKVQPDTRNPVLATALEVLGITENRYSGIPTMKKELKKYGLSGPEFADQRGQFSVKFYKSNEKDGMAIMDIEDDDDAMNLISFCKTPRTRKEIAEYLGMASVSYAVQSYVMPLVKAGKIQMSIPDRPRSPKQLFFS